MIQWFIWDLGIGVRMHFFVDSCRLLEDKQSLAREDCNVPKNDMHANPKICIRRLFEPKGYALLLFIIKIWFGEL